MVKVEVIIDNFSLKKFNELKNLERKKESKNKQGFLYEGDTFECSKEMSVYLTGKNPLNLQVVKIIEVIPEKEEITEEDVQAVAKAIVEEAEERKETVENIVDEIIEETEEIEEKKPKKTISKKKKEEK